MQHRLPTMFTFKYYVEAGGLMSYGIDTVPIFRRLPVVQSSKFELVINSQTATVLGIDVPPTLLARADEVIE